MNLQNSYFLQKKTNKKGEKRRNRCLCGRQQAVEGRQVRRGPVPQPRQALQITSRCFCLFLFLKKLPLDCTHPPPRVLTGQDPPGSPSVGGKPGRCQGESICRSCPRTRPDAAPGLTSPWREAWLGGTGPPRQTKNEIGTHLGPDIHTGF